MASASDPPAHPALQPADRLILPPLPPRAAVETSIGPPHYPAESTQSHAFVQPSLRARKGHANSDSFGSGARGGIEKMFTRHPDGCEDRCADVRPATNFPKEPTNDHRPLLIRRGRAGWFRA